MKQNQANIPMKKQDPARAIKTLEHSLAILSIVLIARVGLFLAFILPLKLHPEYNHGGGDIAALFYFGPMIIVDVFLVIYYIYILTTVYRVKRDGNYFEPMKKYFQISTILVIIWIILAIGTLLWQIFVKSS